MSLFELILVSVSLAMDAFSISVCIGITKRNLTLRDALKASLFFGIAQALMPMLGWLVGSAVSEYIGNFDSWIAFLVLGYIGGKLIWDAVKSMKDKSGEAENGPDMTDTKRLLLLALATSVDALAVGLSLALLGGGIFASSITIGAITFALCFLGVLLGSKLGSMFKNWAQVVGGAVLVLIGLNILIQSLI